MIKDNSKRELSEKYNISRCNMATRSASRTKQNDIDIFEFDANDND